MANLFEFKSIFMSFHELQLSYILHTSDAASSAKRE